MKMHAHPASEARLATGVRVIFVVTLIGLIAGVTGLSAFGPQAELGYVDDRPAAASASAGDAAVDKTHAQDTATPQAAGTPGYFPSQFPAPKNGPEEQSPTF
jgi:hypothetical protein